MQKLTVSLALVENGKQLPLSVLVNRAGYWLRGQCPDTLVLEKQNQYFPDGRKEIGYLKFLGYEITARKLKLRYNYQPGVRRSHDPI